MAPATLPRQRDRPPAPHLCSRGLVGEVLGHGGACLQRAALRPAATARSGAISGASGGVAAGGGGGQPTRPGAAPGALWPLLDAAGAELRGQGLPQKGAGRGGVSESGRRGMVRPRRATGLTLPARARGAAAREAPAIVAALQEAAGVIAAGARVLAKRPGVQGSVGRGRGQARWAALAAQPPVYVVTVSMHGAPTGRTAPFASRPAAIAAVASSCDRFAASRCSWRRRPAAVVAGAARVAAPTGAAAPSTSTPQRAQSRLNFSEGNCTG